MTQSRIIVLFIRLFQNGSGVSGKGGISKSRPTPAGPFSGVGVLLSLAAFKKA